MTSSTINETGTGVELYRLQTSADLRELTRIRHALRESVAELPGADNLQEFLNEMELAVVETASNVIRHACPDRDRTLTHIVSLQSGLLTYEIVHDGIGFEGAESEVPEVTDPAEGGMGLFIIAQCVDSISYSPATDGLQAIVLTKTLNTAEKPMEATIEKVNGVVLVTAQYESIDAGNVDCFKRDVSAVIEDGAQVVLDLTCVEFVDSAGLGGIVWFLKKLASCRGELKVCGVCSSVQALFELIRMHRLIAIYSDREEAQSAFLEA